MKVLITGGAGYLGAKTAENLSTHGHGVFIHCREMRDNIRNFAERAKLSVLTGDIRDTETIDKIIQLDADCVIHTVSLDHTQSEGDISEVNSVNFNPFFNILKRLKDRKNSRVIYFSTTQVYGRELAGKIDENKAAAPVNVYGLTHRFCEECAGYFARNHGLKAVNLRLSNIYGPPAFDNPNAWKLVLNELCRMAFENGKIVLKSDGSPLRDFVAIDDFTEAVCRFAESDASEIKHDIYNVASGNTVTILEAAAEVSKLASSRYKKDIPVILKDGSRADLSKTGKGGKPYVFDNARIDVMGLKIGKSLSGGIEKTFGFLEGLCLK